MTTRKTASKSVKRAPLTNAMLRKAVIETKKEFEGRSIKGLKAWSKGGRQYEKFLGHFGSRSKTGTASSSTR